LGGTFLLPFQLQCPINYAPERVGPTPFKDNSVTNFQDKWDDRMNSLSLLTDSINSGLHSLPDLATFLNELGVSLNQEIKYSSRGMSAY